MNTIENRQNKPPFMRSSKKLSVSDEELEAFYISLRKYYLDVPFDNIQVAREEKYYQIPCKMSQLFSMLKGTKVLHQERIHDNPAMLYTANHIGSYDQFFIPSILDNTPLHYLVKNKVTTWPVRWNLIYKPTGAVIVEPESLRSWNHAKAKLIQYLLHGSKVFIFAEGSRRGENNMGDFNPGVAQIAQETGVKIGTLAIKNTSKLFLRKPVICAGEVFSVGPREDLKVATERIKSGVLNAYNEILVYESEL
ncbi:MAG: 1-acyl-sn-glycerol-3-phosphate acyltransferase [Oscillospiraceae bacterium]|nr:1-acyl-sn-glycerol-3-phosphate acyltransferase [Oscillospiraceae bacterium]